MDVQPPDKRTIFEHALEFASGAEREAYLEDACAGKPEMRAQVDSLLKAHNDVGSFLDGPAFDAQRTAPMEPISEQPGTIIGPYKLLEQIGEGGFGVVYMAEQQQPVRRKVALKVVKPGMDSRQVLARFEAERQALAIMDHPNIAKVFDAGVTDTGRLYFVMELVKGTSITRYCDEKHLTPRDRLELFVHVCQAVQHAHQKGIIHRDIKPNNVLVAQYDGKPVPKVIDFGVAKATGQALTERTMFTGFGDVIGTLEYMSPEQAEVNQLDVDTRSDIYSLGVLLYELLTGTTPLEHKRVMKAGLLEMLRVVREEEPPKPSMRLTATVELPSIAACRGLEPRSLSGIVKGELDWIVMRALEKDRSRRYETANGMAMDVQRYLNDDTVQACPPSAGYRLRKFARRNKGPVITAALVLLTLIAGIVGTSVGLVRAERARRAEVARAEGERKAKQLAQEREAEAKQREAETEAVLDFVENKVLAAARPKGDGGGLGYDVPLRRAIEAALPFVEASFKDRPLIEARLRVTLATSFSQLGEAKIAAEQAEAARALYAQHLGPHHLNTVSSMAALANAFEDPARKEEALKLREEVLSVRRARLGPDHQLTVGSMHNLANSYDAVGRKQEALKLREEVVRLRKAQLGPDHANTVAALLSLAGSYTNLDRHADAVKLGEETLALCKSKFGSDDRYTLLAAADLACRYQTLGRQADAIRLFQETLPLTKAHFGPVHPRTIGLKRFMADNYTTLGRHAEAAKMFQEILAVQRTELGADDPGTLGTLNAFIECLVRNARGAEAIALIDEYVRQAAGKKPQSDQFPRLIKLRMRHFQGAKDPAGCRETAEMWERMNRTDPVGLYDAACWWAVTAAVRRERAASARAPTSAVAEADRAMDLLRKAVAAGYSNAAHMKNDPDLAGLRERQDFRDLLATVQANSQQAIATARDEVRREPGNDPARQHLGALLNDQAWGLATDADVSTRDPVQAVALAEELLRLAPNGPDYWNTLGVARYRAGNFEEAVSALQKYRELRTTDAEWSNPFFLAMAHHRLGDKEEARQWFDKGAQWMDAHNANSETMVRFRKEAAELLGVNEKK